MNGYNRVTMMGTVATKPELKKVKEYDILEFRIMTVVSMPRKNGPAIQETCYMDVSLFGFKALEIAPFLNSGMPVHVDGRIKFQSWADAEGKKQSKHVIAADNVIVIEAGQSSGVIDKPFEQPFEGF